MLRQIISTALACCVFGGLYAGTASSQHLKKLYVDKSSVHITKKGIVVKTKDGIFKTKALRSDKKGLYIYPKENNQRYYCRACGRYFRNNDDLARHYCPRNCRR